MCNGVFEGYPRRLFELLVYPYTHFTRSLAASSEKGKEEVLGKFSFATTIGHCTTEYETAQHFTFGLSQNLWGLTLAAP